MGGWLLSVTGRYWTEWLEGYDGLIGDVFGMGWEGWLNGLRLLCIVFAIESAFDVFPSILQS